MEGRAGQAVNLVPMSKIPLRRTRFLQAAVGAAATLSAGAPAFVPRLGEAADAIKLGAVVPLTGPYAAAGQSGLSGMQMAVAAANARGGAMSRQIVLVAEDSQADPGVGVQKARKLVNQDKCIGLLGSVSSAVALSVLAAADDLGVLFICTGGHTDDFSMRACRWNGFQVCHSTWMLTHATGYAFTEFGKKWYAITPDYAYGHSIMAGYVDIAKQVGATFVGDDLTPLGTSDFAPYLSKIAASGADVFVCNLGGNDFVDCMKQAEGFGIFSKMRVGGPIGDLQNFLASPPAARVGYWGIEWYYASDLVLGGRKSAHEFVAAYRKRYKEPPTPWTAFGYLGVEMLLSAMDSARTTDAKRVAKALAGKRFAASVFDGEAYVRSDNHALMWPIWVGDVRREGKPPDSDDIFDIKQRIAAEKVTPSSATIEAACKLSYPS